MTNYIHNRRGDKKHANLRFDLDNGKHTATRLPDGTYFVVAIFEDKAGAKSFDDEWKATKTYCGLVGDIFNKESFGDGIAEIMRHGSKPYELACWIKENIKT